MTDDHSPEKMRRRLVEESKVEVDYERIQKERHDAELAGNMDSEDSITAPLRRSWYWRWMGIGDIPWVPDAAFRYRNPEARWLIWLVFGLSLLILAAVIFGIILMR